MGFLSGGILRITELFVLLLCFCCGGIILGVYSYFLAILADRDLPIAREWKAVEGISGAACLWLFVATLPMCICGSFKFVAFLLAATNAAFCAGFIALAVLTRDGADSCSGNVKTPIGSGPADSSSPGYGRDGFGFGNGENATYAPNLHLACRLNTAAFAVSLIGALLFFVAAIVNIALGRHNKRESAYGPSPSNNYTKGTGKRGLGGLAFWKKDNKNKDYGNEDALPHNPESTLMQDKKDEYNGNAYSNAGSYHTGSNAAYSAPPQPSDYAAAPYTQPAVGQQPGVSSHNALLKGENVQNPYAAV